jgi:beta-lactamase regulating signal transducer with metallopeptidase domain
MNSFIETLNQWGGNFLSFAWPMFWQSSLLIAILFAFDFLFRRKIRASVRYALWLVILVKLCVPPTLALPTSPAWWLHKTPPPIVVKADATHYSVTYDNAPPLEIPPTPPPVFVPPKPVLTLAAWLLFFSTSMSLVLLLWLLVRWWQITRQVFLAATSERLTALADEAQKIVGMKLKVQAKLTTNSMSPAVCGLFRPAILIPQSLVENFSDEQLRAVLLHELIHLRRRDVWVNFLQALLQIFYWWHPLVWLANARIRRVREEAVDDAVMLALRDEAETYAPTLLEVAKLALNRPLASLGLVGILESRHALRQRIERLVDFHPPRRAALTLVSLLGILAFTAIAVPMGGAPSETNNSTLSDVSSNFSQASTNISTNTNAAQSRIAMTFRLNQTIHSEDLKTSLLAAGVKTPPTVFFYTDSGFIFARGSKEQMALVNRVVLQLNGFSPKVIEDTEKHFLNDPRTIGTEDSTNLSQRMFKVDANLFPVILRKQTGLKTNSVTEMARSFFSKLGVDLESPKDKSVFYNDRVGSLFVKATNPDLDTIEHAIQVLDDVPPQIHIKARFLEVPEKFFSGAGKNPLPAGATNGTGILTATEAKKFLQVLQSQNSFETLAEPQIIMNSGRQAQMRMTQIITVITNFSYETYPTNNSHTTDIFPQMGKFEFGSTVEAVPTVLSDDYTVFISTTASSVKFLGYADNKSLKYRTRAVTNSYNEKIELPLILPVAQTNLESVQKNLFDGQTLILFPEAQPPFYINTNQNSNSDKSWNDLLLKHALQAEKKSGNKKLVILITVDIVDPTGNRIHSDDEMPFAKSGIPPQPPK